MREKGAAGGRAIVSERECEREVPMVRPAPSGRRPALLGQVPPARAVGRMV